MRVDITGLYGLIPGGVTLTFIQSHRVLKSQHVCACLLAKLSIGQAEISYAVESVS